MRIRVSVMCAAAIGAAAAALLPAVLRSAPRTTATAPSDPPMAQLLQHIPPTAPEDSLRTFRVAPGFHVELVAAEPLVSDPCDIAFDEDGRMWVAELWNYPGEPKPGEPLGHVRRLEDTDGTGRYDKSTIVADQIRWPSGVMPWKGGAFVLSSPDLMYLKDTDGDGKADVRDRVYTGFAGRTYEVPNSLRWGPDNRIYGAGSYAGGSVTPVGDANGKREAIKFGHSRDYRFDPRRLQQPGAFQTTSGSGEWGNTFDDDGNRFTCNATTLVIHGVLPVEYISGNPFYVPPRIIETPAGEWAPIHPISPPEPWKVVREQFWSKWKNSSSDFRAGRFPPRELAPHGYATAAAGITAYTGSAYGDGFRNNVFIGEPANNAVVRLHLKPSGLGFEAERAPGEVNTDFLASTDNWFRPVNFANGPDGCLYVVAMYREVIEDESAIPNDILRHYDLYSGRERGRIYRIVRDGFKRPPSPRLSQADTAALASALDRPDGWWRETAQRLIYERQDKALVDPLKKLVSEGKLAATRVAALWSLKGLDALDEPTLWLALRDDSELVRAAAVKLSEPLLNTSAETEARVTSLSDDPSLRARFQVALTLGELREDRSSPVLAKMMLRDAHDPWMREAILVSAREDRAATLFRYGAQADDFRHSAEGAEMLGQLAMMVGLRAAPAHVREVLAAAIDRKGDTGFQRNTLQHVAEGLAKSGSSLGVILRGEGDQAVAMRATVDAFFTDARQAASDEKRNERDRVDAIGLLGYAPFDSVGDTFKTLLDPAQPPAVQMSAVRALGAQTEGAGVAKLIVDRWRSLGPEVRALAMDVLFRRPERLSIFLDAIESRRISANELDPSRRQSILKSSDKGIRTRAAALLGGPPSSDRQKLIDRYLAAMPGLAGDPNRGREVFQKNCAVCHQQDKQKKNVAPNLAILEDRSPNTLLVSILDPNRDVKPIYVAYTLITKDGQDFTGVIANETESAVTIRRAGGLEDTVFRNNIQRLTSSGQSLMPEGLESAVSVQQMADLLRFLQQYK